MPNINFSLKLKAMDKEYAKKIISKTTDDYNRIAEHWSSKRWQLPSDILALADYIKEGDNVLDLGCGNGYFYDEVIQKKALYTGADVSENQLKVCRRLHPESTLVLTEPLKLPFMENVFDKIFCLSTIHHIPSQEFQLTFLAEIARVLKKDGQLYLTAWNLTDQELTHSYSKMDEDGNILYPFKDSDGVTMVDRFIHVFTIAELTEIVEASGFKVIEGKVVSRGYGKFSNNLIIAEKI